MRRLLAAHEIWSFEEEDFGHVGYAIAWEEDGKQYRVEHMGKSYVLDNLKLEAPDPIPLEYLTTPWTDTYLQAPKPLPPDVYLKTSPAVNYEPTYPTLLSEKMRKEIEVYIKLSRSPHPNVCPFYGCIRDGSRVSALALKQIPHKLPYIWKDAEYKVSKLSILRGVKRGLDHIHGLGIIHNDINPTNLRLDELLRPVLIDFNAARYEGEPMEEYAGTPGWFRLSPISRHKNDIFALGQLGKWLDGWQADPEVTIEQEEPCPWTEDYLSPKIIAAGPPSTVYESILSQLLNSGAYLTLLNADDPPVSMLKQAPLAFDRMTVAPAHSSEEYAAAWTTAGKGLRSEEVDVVFFPISMDILHKDSHEYRQLELLLSTIPHNLRPRHMQPRLILFDETSSFTDRENLRKLEDALISLVSHCWRVADDSDDVERPASSIPDVFQHFALVQPGGWFSWNRLRVRLWQTSSIGSDPAMQRFEETTALVALDSLMDFVLDPPKTHRPSALRKYVEGYVPSIARIDDPALLAFVMAQATLTLYIVGRIARVY